MHFGWEKIYKIILSKVFSFILSFLSGFVPKVGKIPFWMRNYS
jgi:hypothetical protein